MQWYKKKEQNKWFFKNKLLPSRLEQQNTPTASLNKSKNPYQRVSWYNTKQFDGEAPVMQELWGMRSTPSLP